MPRLSFSYRLSLELMGRKKMPVNDSSSHLKSIVEANEVNSTNKVSVLYYLQSGDRKLIYPNFSWIKSNLHHLCWGKNPHCCNYPLNICIGFPIFWPSPSQKSGSCVIAEKWSHSALTQGALIWDILHTLSGTSGIFILALSLSHKGCTTA